MHYKFRQLMLGGRFSHNFMGSSLTGKASIAESAIRQIFWGLPVFHAFNVL